MFMHEICIYQHIYEVYTVYMHIYTYYLYIFPGKCFKYPRKSMGDTSSNWVPLSRDRGRNDVGVRLFTVLS